MSNNDIHPGFDEETCDFLTISLRKVEGVDDTVVLRLKGQVDTYSSNFFQRSAKKLIDAGFVRLILILDSVDYVSSKAVGAFVQIKKAATDKGGRNCDRRYSAEGHGDFQESESRQVSLLHGFPG